MKSIKQLKKGELFRLSESPNGRVYIRGEYDRSLRKYMCGVRDDISETRLFKGDKLVYTEFVF